MEKINDASPRVAFQASLSVGEFSGKETILALTKVIAKYGQDPWFRTAVLSSDAGSSADLVKTLSQQAFFQQAAPWKASFLEDLAFVIGARNQKEQVNTFLGFLSQPELEQEGSWQLAAVQGLTKGLAKVAGQNPQLGVTLKNINTSSPSGVKAAVAELKKLY
jgi:hypothetical protein